MLFEKFTKLVQGSRYCVFSGQCRIHASSQAAANGGGERLLESKCSTDDFQVSPQ